MAPDLLAAVAGAALSSARFPACQCLGVNGAPKQRCPPLDRWPGAVAVPADSVHLRLNMTQRLAEAGHASSSWLLPMSRAVTELVDVAVSTRVRCGQGSVKECSRLMEIWGYSWCLFLRRLRAAARVLPAAGLITSALGTSMASVMAGELPEALSEPAFGVASGSWPFAKALAAIANTSHVFVNYLDSALLLGEEMVRFGSSRVRHAVFHGESAAAGEEEGLSHRADVLLWALARHGRPRAPLVAELGVAAAEVSLRLLQRDPELRWLGVDSYEGRLHTDTATWEPGRKAGDRALAIALNSLEPFVGRAQLIRSRTTEVKDAALGGESLDLLYVDALHSEEGARADLEHWVPRVRPGGLVAGHDYDWNYPGVAWAAHSALPAGTTLHLGPNSVFWWQKPL